MQSETHRLWYVRLAGKVSGPFPTAAIAQDLALRRLPAQVELSGDRVSWAQAADLAAFSHLLRPDESDAWAEQRRQALHRWADERGGHDRRAAGSRHARRERRQACSRQRTATLPVRELVRSGWLVFASLGLLLLGLALLALLLGQAPAVNLLK